MTHLGHNGGPDWDALETPLDEQPLFMVEAPGDKPDDPAKWSETYRQRSFVTWLRNKAPAGLWAFSIANERRVSMQEGKRLKAMGWTPGIPDVVVLWGGGMAFCEFKGWSKDGRPGKLSAAQVEVCNKIHRNGHPVACFFRAETALRWLKGVGAPL